MPNFIEMDARVSLADQLATQGDGSVILANLFVAPQEDLATFEEIWAKDAAIMKAQPGFISTQLHRGIAGSGAFLNIAVWQSVAHFRAAFANPEFRARLGDYRTEVKVSPHLFRKVSVPGICVD